MSTPAQHLFKVCFYAQPVPRRRGGSDYSTRFALDNAHRERLRRTARTATDYKTPNVTCSPLSPSCDCPTNAGLPTTSDLSDDAADSQSPNAPGSCPENAINSHVRAANSLHKNVLWRVSSAGPRASGMAARCSSKEPAACSSRASCPVASDWLGALDSSSERLGERGVCVLQGMGIFSGRNRPQREMKKNSPAHEGGDKVPKNKGIRYLGKVLSHGPGESSCYFLLQTSLRGRQIFPCMYSMRAGQCSRPVPPEIRT